MADDQTIETIETPSYNPHPFLIDSLPNNKGPYYLARVESGFMVRIDMPGISRDQLKLFKVPEKRMVIFKIITPRRVFHLDRVYGGSIRLNFDPSELRLKVCVKYGSVHMFFPEGLGQLRFQPKIAPDEISWTETLISGGSLIVEDEGSSSGISILPYEAIDYPPRSHDERENAGGDVDNDEENAAKNEEANDVILKLLSLGYNCEGSDESKQAEHSPSGKSVAEAEAIILKSLPLRYISEGSEKSKQAEHSPSGKSVAEAEGSGKQPLDQHSFESVKDWINACVKKHILGMDVPEPPKGVAPETKSVPMETSATDSQQSQPGHKPQVAIGSVSKCQLHKPQCECGKCDTDGIYLKIGWRTDENYPNINRLIVFEDDKLYEMEMIEDHEKGFSLLVRVELPGLEKERCRVICHDSCILVFGEPQPKEQLLLGARNYLFCLKLLCSCCKFYEHCHEYQDGLLNLDCSIIGKNDDSH